MTDDAAYDAWGEAYNEAARKEGWSIFECSGSEYGRWQIQRFDDPGDECAELGDDDEAWKIVIEGSGEHHCTARKFIKTYNPPEWTLWCKYAHKLKLDKNKLSPELLSDIVAGALS